MHIRPIKAAIFGCAGERLTSEEKERFRDWNPFGYILFARNCVDPEQVKALVSELKDIAGRDKLAILIDQEGGRVARLKPPHWREAPAPGALAALAQEDLAAARKALYLNARLLAYELCQLGITVNCAPLADLPAPGSHGIIGDRALGTTPEQVSMLARSFAEGLLDGGVLPVLKHIPGHGRATVDSHESLPVVEEPLTVLEATDFAAFHALRDLPLGMTAHVLYKALDAGRVATLSSTVLQYIRDKIGFDGLLMSDDLSMKALDGDIGALARETLAAGCDLVLHCNGKMEEMLPIAEAAGPLSPQAERRAQRAWSQFHAPLAFDHAQALAQLESLQAKAAA